MHRDPIKYCEFYCKTLTPVTMETCVGLLHSKSCSTRMSLTLLCSMLCMWTSVDSWSYFYSNKTMDWPQARVWCQEHYTDMVAIQNQEEIRHLDTWLPRRKGYYWIGIRKVGGVWTWVGTNKSLTAEATNWAKGEPNNGRSHHSSKESEDCVEMYVNRTQQSGKWNDERCDKHKTALCYTAACKGDLCLHGECVETINSHKCECFEGFYGDKCEQVVTCDPEEVTVPAQGSVTCTHTNGDFAYDSSCEYSCEAGYRLNMPRPLRCTASKLWSEEPPACEPVRCPAPSPPAGTSVTCSDPLGPSSYGSTCVFTCDEGHEHSGPPPGALRCEASGSWNASTPSCVAVRLPDVRLESGSVDCRLGGRKFICDFVCGPGFRLEGASTLTAASAADVEERMPRCEAITCQRPEGDAHLMATCGGGLPGDLRPGSTCSFGCGSGFELHGARVIRCSDEGEWSTALPRCTAIGCPALEDPAHGQVTCGLPKSPASPGHPRPLGTTCTFSCDEGHELRGARGALCEPPGRWSATAPTCTVVSCPTLEAPENGNVNCSSGGAVYDSQCSFTCDRDHSLDGSELLTCDRHGNWTAERPTCRASRSEVTAIVSGLATGGTLLSGLSLAAWILKRLKQKKDAFELNSNSDIEAPLQVYRNSIDSLI